MQRTTGNCTRYGHRRGRGVCGLEALGAQPSRGEGMDSTLEGLKSAGTKLTLHSAAYKSGHRTLLDSRMSLHYRKAFPIAAFRAATIRGPRLWNPSSAIADSRISSCVRTTSSERIQRMRLTSCEDVYSPIESPRRTFGRIPRTGETATGTTGKSVFETY